MACRRLLGLILRPVVDRKGMSLRRVASNVPRLRRNWCIRYLDYYLGGSVALTAASMPCAN